LAGDPETPDSVNRQETVVQVMPEVLSEAEIVPKEG